MRKIRGNFEWQGCSLADRINNTVRTLAQEFIISEPLESRGSLISEDKRWLRSEWNGCAGRFVLSGLADKKRGRRGKIRRGLRLLPTQLVRWQQLTRMEAEINAAFRGVSRPIRAAIGNAARFPDNYPLIGTNAIRLRWTGRFARYVLFN